MLNKRLAAASLAASLSLGAVLVSAFEGVKTKAYLDSVGIATICYGHTSTVRMGQTKTIEECDKLLKEDLLIAAGDVKRLVKVELPAERRAALISFVFNIGGEKFASSTVLKKLNSGDASGSCAELSRWVYAGGVKLEGLVSRRAVERELCEVGL